MIIVATGKDETINVTLGGNGHADEELTAAVCETAIALSEKVSDPADETFAWLIGRICQLSKTYLEKKNRS